MTYNPTLQKIIDRRRKAKAKTQEDIVAEMPDDVVQTVRDNMPSEQNTGGKTHSQNKKHRFFQLVDEHQLKFKTTKAVTKTIANKGSPNIKYFFLNFIFLTSFQCIS